ncbi:FAD-dependent monooxygenase [Sorangium sp. So ce693]|uniref:FAD-dependent oxidoreductase n=1 Tax=Sorangium sp. So ce693 TaxID=3133318 RepID=UPI003F627FE1
MGPHDTVAAGRGGHAVVVGGGLGGLLAAQVLRRRFGRVTVIERDRDLSRLGHRKGVPQGRCLHLLMAGGLNLVERILPGFGDDLAGAGAVPFDFGEQAAVRLQHGWLPRFRSGIIVYACSRGLLEGVLRRRVLAEPGIVLLEGRVATGLVAAGGGVTGVRVRRGDDAAGEALDADLVVVADGSGSALPGWLVDLGLPPPEITEIEAETQYTSCWFEIPRAFRDDWRFLSIAAAERRDLRSGAVLEAEGRRWSVVLLGPRDEEAPDDHGAFLRAASRLPDLRLHDALSEAQPLSPVHHYGRSRSRIYHYERAGVWPDRLVALGDAVCALDPYFGLGMTACARGVDDLEQELMAGLVAPGGTRRFQARLARTNAAPWKIVTGRDWDGRVDAMQSFALAGVLRLAPESPAAARVLLDRVHLLAPPDAILAPEVMELVGAELGQPLGTPPRTAGSR